MKYVNVINTVALVKITESEVPTDQTLLEALRPMIGFSPCVVLDVEGVLLTSAQIGDIVNLAKELSDTWGDQFRRVALINVSDHGKQVFQVVKLDKMITLFDSRDEALDHLSAVSLA
ncbi:MAG: hypothetical protein OEW12_08065 [Deltaproteobacteria bacterium]|nr:hypothetical protein [Deltaproteobacteria bacterium]